jgi:hypothetical protein
MNKIFCFIIISVLYISQALTAQSVNFDTLFDNINLKQLKNGSLTIIDNQSKYKGKILILKSLERGCKYRLEEMSYYNNLKNENYDNLEVILTFIEDPVLINNY